MCTLVFIVIAALIFGLVMERRRRNNHLRPEPSKILLNILMARPDSHVYLGSGNLFKANSENDFIGIFTATHQSLEEVQIKNQASQKNVGNLNWSGRAPV